MLHVRFLGFRRHLSPTHRRFLGVARERIDFFVPEPWQELTEDLGLPGAVRGRFRGVRVWIGSSESTKETARYAPPPEVVPKLVDEWLAWWHEWHRGLRGKGKEEIIVGLAELHHRFLLIHPFMDANGRIARAVTDQTARELLNESVGPEFIEDVAGYYSALVAADKEDLKPLQDRIKAALS